jgi:hypothetical protein
LARERVFTYFCFIESPILATPHMQPLDVADTRAAHVFRGDERIATITADGIQP